MCWCTPGIKTPCCGGPNCHPPKTTVSTDTLYINFGKGRLLINKFTSDDGRRGLIIKDTGEDHIVGETADDEPIGKYQPQPGEIVAAFANPESAMVVRQLLDEIIEGWTVKPRESHRV